MRSPLIASTTIESPGAANGRREVKDVYFKASRKENYRHIQREVKGRDDSGWTLSNTAFSKILKPNDSC